MSLETKVADLERTLDMLVNPPINGRIAMINAVAGDKNYPDSVYVLTTEGQVWEGTWRLPGHKFSWERIPDLPEGA